MRNHLGTKFGYALIHALFLGAAVVAAPSADARAPDQTRTVSCPQKAPPGTEYTSLAIDLERFSIPADWSEGGPHYEVTSRINFRVYATPGGGTPTCTGSVNWGTREYPKFNAWSGNQWTYPLELMLVLHNVPKDGFVRLDVFMVEEDSESADDVLDLNRYPGLAYAPLRIFPARQRAYLLPPSGVEIDDSTHGVDFARTKRVTGDGSGGDVAASLDLRIDMAPPPVVGGTATKKDPKVAGAVSCAQYAQTAVGLHAAAKHKGCKVQAPFWSDRYGEHLAWCQHGNNASRAAQANADRRKELDTCTPQDPKIVVVPPLNDDAVCRDYALTAVQRNQEAIAANCGFQPPVWSSDHQAHFDWCMQMQSSGQAQAVSAGTALRAQMLAQCKGN